MTQVATGANIAVYLDGECLNIIESNRPTAQAYWSERQWRFPDRRYRLVDIPSAQVPHPKLKDQLRRAA
ncbi:MAG: hypothetical protein KME20_26885 [Kaiparowitsia implicata GSE-PSE-MK54-09C]|jgi:hypothetical protein|nr:hypothetical protein [Kaiparowitsia implicata GSE-PSE-MK54-09C]